MENCLLLKLLFIYFIFAKFYYIVAVPLYDIFNYRLQAKELKKEKQPRRQVVCHSQGVVYKGLIIPVGTNTKQPNQTPKRNT